MIRGRALETMVEARMLTNMPSIRPESACTTSRCDIRPEFSAVVSGCTAVIGFFPSRRGWWMGIEAVVATAGRAV
ncbi:hypothetical protein GCM10025331_52750 [Actinoplanes utahensis]